MATQTEAETAPEPPIAGSGTIDVRDLSKSFGHLEVLRSLNLHVDSGSIFALLGPNGSGKTTLINILSTLLRPDSGTATVAGFDVVRERGSVKSRISLTGQSAAVDEVLSAPENLRMMARLSGLGRADAARRADALLDQLDLRSAGRARAASFSGGIRRRLDLAISLILTPPVVFLDEPTTGLDTRSRAELWAIIRDLAAAGTTVFLTTQYLEEADQLADRVAVLDHGVIVAEGSPAELKARIGGEVVSLLDHNGGLRREIAIDGSVESLRVALAELEGDDGDSVTLRRPSLDDVFLALTGTAAHPQSASITSTNLTKELS